MKSVQLPADGQNNFILNIDVNIVARTTKNFVDADGTTIKLEGKTIIYNFNGEQDKTPEAIAAKTTMTSAVEQAFATYWLTVNSSK